MPARPTPRGATAPAVGVSATIASVGAISNVAPGVVPGFLTGATVAAASVPPVLRAGPSHLAYVVALQKRNHEALGFIPRAALAEKIDLGRVWLATENGDPAGFLHHGSLAVP